jgi:mycothiol synthase
MSQLKMEKNDLESVPAIAKPKGYVLRTFRDGDEAGIAKVYGASELGCATPEEVRSRMLGDPRYRPGRLLVLTCQDQLVGTAAAWTDADDPDVGYLHMVGLLPEYRGRNLGALLTVAAINQARLEGFRLQRLDTDDWRLPALRLYLALGYYPVLLDDTHPRRWHAIAEKLRKPDILSRARQG